MKNHSGISSRHSAEVKGEARDRRRSCILDAALDIASRNGYDGTHMRTVADDANLATATVYHYFPSKTHLIVALLSRELEELEDEFSTQLSEVDDQYLRLQIVIRSLTSQMEDRPTLSYALIKGFAHGTVTIDCGIQEVTDQVSGLFAHSMSRDRPTRYHHHVGDVFADMWTSAVIGLAHGSTTIGETRRLLCRTTVLLAQRQQDGLTEKRSQNDVTGDGRGGPIRCDLDPCLGGSSD